MKPSRFGLILLLLALPLALLADPVPKYATFLGGTGWDQIWGITTDASGAVYVIGDTGSTNFPHGQAFEDTGTFVAKFTADGRTLVYSTVIGYFTGRGIAVDGAGSAYLVGPTWGPPLPMPSTAQTEFGGETDIAIVKMSPDGSSIAYATFLGGSGTEVAKAIAVDGNGSAYVVGQTGSSDLRTTTGAAQTVYGGRKDAFVAKLNPAGTAFEYVSYLGGTNYETANGLAIDGQHRVYVTGQTRSPKFKPEVEPRLFGPADSTDLAIEHGEAFVARLNAAGSQLDFLALVRGSGVENGVALALDAAGRAVVLGMTDSWDFPATPNAAMPALLGGRDMFVTRLAPEGDGLEFATFLGSGYYEYFGNEWFTGYQLHFGGIALDASDDILLSAYTDGRVWPGVRGVGLDPGAGAMVLKLRRDGDRLDWLRFVGGSGDGELRGLAVNPQGNVWVAGYANRSAQPPVFPTTDPALQPDYGGGGNDAFLVRLEEPAGAVANNSFAGRLNLPRSPVTAFFTTVGATNDALGRALWWSWTAPANGFLTLRVDSLVTNVFTAALEVYTGASLAALGPVTSNDAGATNRILFPVSAGVAYSIALGVVATEAVEGLFSLEFSAPPNDDFVNRWTIPSEIPVTVTGSNVNATTEPAENNLNHYPWTWGYGPSVWWEWVSPSNVTVAVIVTNSDFHALVQAYSGDTLSSDPDQQLRGLTSTPYGDITFDADAGAHYQLGVFGDFGEVGTIQLTIAVASPPANDRFEAAAVLVENAAAVSISSRNATPEPGEPALLSEANGLHSLWWKWTAPGRGYARASVENGQFPPAIGVFTGALLGQLQLVDKHIRSGDYGAAAEVRFATMAGTTYSILVNDQLTSLGGPMNVALQFVPYAIRADTIQLLGNGRIRFLVAGESGKSYQIETSPDLKSWAPAPGGAFTGPDFAFEISFLTDSRQFYRLTPVP